MSYKLVDNRLSVSQSCLGTYKSLATFQVALTGMILFYLQICVIKIKNIYLVIRNISCSPPQLLTYKSSVFYLLTLQLSAVLIGLTETSVTINNIRLLRH